MCSDTPIMIRDTTSLPTLAMLHGVSSHPSNGGDQTNEAFVSVVKSRKGWKSSKTGEAVWPLELEAALVEGMKKYVPRNVREARSLGRFPLRNRFISDYIYQQTGKRRTPKQVGSRIQQMRDTSAGRQLLELLRPYVLQRRPDNYSSSGILCNGSISTGHQDSEDAHSDTDSSESSSGLETELTNVVYIDLIPPLSLPQTAAEIEGILLTNGIHKTGSSIQPRHIHYIDPTVAFLSQTPISAHAVYRVHRHGTVVHTENTALEYAGHVASETPDMHHKGDNPHLYRSALVPGYWERICNSAVPTQFTIEQEIRLDSSAASDRPLFFSLYKFRFIQNPPSFSDSQQAHIKHLSIHDGFGDLTTEDQHSSTIWDISAFLGPPLEVDVTLEDGALFEECLLSKIQSPPSTISSPESQSNTLFSPSPPSRPHSTPLVSPCTSDLSDNHMRLPSPIWSPAVMTSTTPFTFPTVDHDTHMQKEIETYFNTFHFSTDLDLNDVIW